MPEPCAPPTRSALRDDRAIHYFAELTEYILGWQAKLVETRSALQKRLGSLLVEHPSIDRAVVQFTERQQRGQRHAAISATERPRLKQSKRESCRFIGKCGVGLASERRDLRTLYSAHQSELRLDDAGMRLRAAELGTHRLVQVDYVLDRQIVDATVSR